MAKAAKAKTRSLAKGERTVLLPGATGAEPWEVWVGSSAATPSCIEVCATPGENRLGRDATLALPAAQVYCVPLWLSETDPKQFGGVIGLQLELRNLQRGNNMAVYDWSVAAQEGTRTLVMVGVLPALLPLEMEAVAYRAFDVSARYFVLPDNSISLWLEQDRITFAITRGSSLVYFQALGEEHLTPRALQDISSARAALKMQGVLENLSQVFLAMPVTGAELSLVRESLSLPIQQGERPLPRWPSSPWKLVPPQVNVAKKTRDTRRWQVRGLLLGLVLYVLTVVWFVSNYFITSAHVQELRKWKIQNAPMLQTVEDTKAAWRELRPVVDETSYPLELLLHVSEALPTDQLHLTLYESHEGNLLLKGEAKNVAAAFQFLDRLKHDARFSRYNWEMSQPRLLPNDLAQLQIEGTDASTH